MGSAGSVSKEQLTEEQVKAMIERFCYLDENNDGTISLEELKLEHRNFDGDAYDEAAIDAEFKKLDANHDGSVSLVEYLTSRGVDLKSFKAEHAERQRQAVLAEQALIREQGVSAVEIIPDGQEAATCQAVAEAAFVNAAVVGDDAMRCARAESPVVKTRRRQRLPPAPFATAPPRSAVALVAGDSSVELFGAAVPEAAPQIADVALADGTLLPGDDAAAGVAVIAQPAQLQRRGSTDV